MRFRMVGRFIPKGSEIEWYRYRVRPDVIDIVREKTINIEFIEENTQKIFHTKGKAGTHFKCSTETKDPVLAERRRVHIHAFLTSYYDSALAGHNPLTQRQIGELAREVYDKYIEIYGDDPPEVNVLQAVKAWNRAVAEGREVNPPGLDIFGGPFEDERTALVIFGVDLTAGVNSLTPGQDNREAMERRFGDAATWVLRTRDLSIDAVARRRLLIVVGKASSDAQKELIKRKTGDYSPDLNREKYPKYVAPRELFTLEMLFDLWKKDGKRPKMVANVKPIVASFKLIVKEKDIREIDKTDIAKWRAAMKANPKTGVRTINASSLNMMSALFNVAIRDGIIVGADGKSRGENIFKGTKDKGSTIPKPKMERYNDDEIKRLLTLARQQTNRIDRRWIPWICTCTGARVGEVAQMYKDSIRSTTEGIAYFVIKPDPDSHEKKLKSNSADRKVPVHSVLINEGLLEFWNTLDDGPVFYKAGRKTANRSAHTSVAGNIATWIRKNGFTEKLKLPTHSFRRWFRTAASDSGVPIELAFDMIGHEQGEVDAGYVVPDVDQLKPQIEKIKIPIPD